MLNFAGVKTISGYVEECHYYQEIYADIVSSQVHTETKQMWQKCSKLVNLGKGNVYGFY